MATNTERKAELRTTAENLCSVYNEQILNGVKHPVIDKKIGETDQVKTVDLFDEIKEVVNQYTSVARQECYDECVATGDAMLEAVKRLTFASIGTTFEKVGEDKEIEIIKIIDKDKTIDLAGLHRFAGGIGKDKSWISQVEKFNFHMTARQAKRVVKNKANLTALLKEINDSYAMSKVAQEIDMGKDPTSNTKLLGTLQDIVTAMVGEEYKATSHDRDFLCDIYAGKGKTALTVNCANHKFFRTYILAVCHSIVTGEDYQVSFKKAQAK